MVQIRYAASDADAGQIGALIECVRPNTADVAADSGGSQFAVQERVGGNVPDSFGGRIAASLTSWKFNKGSLGFVQQNAVNAAINLIVVFHINCVKAATSIKRLYTDIGHAAWNRDCGKASAALKCIVANVHEPGAK